ncbi:MAG: 2-amino-4-hydroxy-6-hydroxymethyldihydropteridine diphosphokinase [Pseudoxanthomonas sp.]
MNGTTVAYVGLGGNVGDSRATLLAALASIGILPQTRLRARSALYRTPAWGLEAQPDFLNAVVQVETGLSPEALLEGLLGIERRFGRDRAEEVRWGPRTLDLDLLLYGEHVLALPALEVPHPRLAGRAFALVPLLEIAPEVSIPGVGLARDALSRLPMPDILRLSEDNGGL